MKDIVSLLTKPVPIPKGYHDFADKRTLIKGIPNTLDILSNLAIALPGIYLICEQKKLSFLSINILLLAITSVYYHINPNDTTIFLDMIFLASVNTIIFSFFVNKEIGQVVYVLGILSVLYWKRTGDIRLYEFLKIGIPIYALIQLITNDKVSHYLVPFIILGVLVRYTEFNDKAIFTLTNGLISGHTIKHILGGIELYIVILLLKELNKV